MQAPTNHRVYRRTSGSVRLFMNSHVLVSKDSIHSKSVVYAACWCSQRLHLCKGCFHANKSIT
jgi:hypothetical protein